MGLYCALFISFLKYYFDLLFLSKEKQRENLLKSFIKWHGKGYRFWYYRYPEYEYNNNLDFYYLSTIEDDEIYIHFINKGTSVINSFNFIMGHNVKLLDTMDFQSFIKKNFINSYEFKHYKTKDSIISVIKIINITSSACCTGKTFESIIKNDFYKSYIPVYVGFIPTYFRRHQ